MYKNSDARLRVLASLRTGGEATVEDLATHLGLVPVTVRSHLAALRAQGLVDSRDERGRVGRPRRRFFLTPMGEARFPHRYPDLVEDLLHAVRTLSGSRGLEQVLDLAAAHCVRSWQAEPLAWSNLEERVAAAAERLNAEGGEVIWEKSGERYLLREAYCPYAEVSAAGQEVCRYHLQVVTRLIGQPAHLERSLARGDRCCVFAVSEHAASPPATVRTLSDGRVAPARRPA